jgi:hypothetical protein
MTPPPARISGRLAFNSISRALPTASGEPGVRQLNICECSSGSGTSVSPVRIQRSYGTSMWTGPGRPVRASLNAFGRNLARSSTDCAWKLRFVITFAIDGKSAW